MLLRNGVLGNDSTESTSGRESLPSKSWLRQFVVLLQILLLQLGEQICKCHQIPKGWEIKSWSPGQKFWSVSSHLQPERLKDSQKKNCKSLQHALPGQWARYSSSIAEYFSLEYALQAKLAWLSATWFETGFFEHSNTLAIHITISSIAITTSGAKHDVEAKLEIPTCDV